MGVFSLCLRWARFVYLLCMHPTIPCANRDFEKVYDPSIHHTKGLICYERMHYSLLAYNWKRHQSQCSVLIFSHRKPWNFPSFVRLGTFHVSFTFDLREEMELSFFFWIKHSWFLCWRHQYFIEKEIVLWSRQYQSQCNNCPWTYLWAIYK